MTILKVFPPYQASTKEKLPKIIFYIYYLFWRAQNYCFSGEEHKTVHQWTSFLINYNSFKMLLQSHQTDGLNSNLNQQAYINFFCIGSQDSWVNIVVNSKNGKKSIFLRWNDDLNHQNNILFFCFILCKIYLNNEMFRNRPLNIFNY